MIAPVFAALLLSATLAAVALAPVVDRLAGRRCSRAAMAAAGFALGASLAGGASGWALPVGLVLGAMLLVAGAVDVLAFRLPDVVTLPLIAAGLALAPLQSRSLADAAVGAACGFLVLWAADLAYRALRGRSGIGLGDAKLFAGAGAWLGWQGLIPTLLLTCAGGLAWAALRLLRGRGGANDALPLGPWMALSFWALWLFQASGR